jgi:hypothetical protein
LHPLQEPHPLQELHPLQEPHPPQDPFWQENVPFTLSPGAGESGTSASGTGCKE